MPLQKMSSRRRSSQRCHPGRFRRTRSFWRRRSDRKFVALKELSDWIDYSVFCEYSVFMSDYVYINWLCVNKEELTIFNFSYDQNQNTPDHRNSVFCIQIPLHLLPSIRDLPTLIYLQNRMSNRSYQPIRLWMNQSSKLFLVIRKTIWSDWHLRREKLSVRVYSVSSHSLITHICHVYTSRR